MRWSGPSPAAPSRATFTQLTFQPGDENFPSLSPDGKWCVYSAYTSGGNSDIYLQSVGGRNAINLTKDSTAEDTEPAFSPDGELVAFRSTRAGGGLFVMGRTGEFARPISDVGYNPAWSPDGQDIVYSTDSAFTPWSVSGGGELWIVNLKTGGKRQLTAGNALQPKWSPHNQRVAYWRITDSSSPQEPGSRRDIWTIAVAGGAPVRVTDDGALDANPIWAPDGRFLYFESDRGGTLNIWRVPIDEETGRTLGPAEPIMAPTSRVVHMSIDGSGTRLAYMASAITSSVYRAAFDPQKGALSGEPVKLPAMMRSRSLPTCRRMGNGWPGLSE